MYVEPVLEKDNKTMYVGPVLVTDINVCKTCSGTMHVEPVLVTDNLLFEPPFSDA